MVGANNAGTALSFLEASVPADDAVVRSFIPDSICDRAAEGDVFEVSPMAQEMFSKNLRAHLQHGGYGLFIDYGHREAGLGDTLQAVRDHKFWPPLRTPGRADLTAHVDFECLPAHWH